MSALKTWVDQNKMIIALLIFIILEVMLYRIFAHSIIEAIYTDNANSFLNKLMSGKTENSLNFYIEKYDILWSRSNIIFVCFILSLSWLFRLLNKNIDFFEEFKKGLLELKKNYLENRKAIRLSLILALCFYSLYLVLGTALIPNYAAHKFTFFFTDSYKWVTLNLSNYHKGSRPLMLLFVEFFGFLRFFSSWVPPINLAVVLNSFFGAVGIFFVSLFFWNYTKKYWQTTLLTVGFGLTMNHLFFSILLESYALSACSIIANYLLLIICLNKQKPYFGYWILVGIFSFGVTITNFGQTLICFTVIVLFFKKDNWLVTILEYIGTIVFLAFLLSLVQHKFFGGEYFFAPAAAEREIVWVRTTIFNDPLLIIQEIIKHFFLVNFVSPSPFPSEIISGETITLNFFARPLNYSIWGLIGTIIWLFMLFNGLYKNLFPAPHETSQADKAFLSCVVLAILQNMAFYSIFNGEEMFLYTCHFTFLVWVLALPRFILNYRYFTLAITLLIIFMGINNLTIIRQIILT